MGLDMYLEARKSFHGYDYNNKDETTQQYKDVVKLFRLPENWKTENGRFASIQLNVAYWRKANAIHNWFVVNVQEGKDECQESYVDRDSLKALIELCQMIIEQPTKAEELLPTQSGFFFGGTDYDEGYFEDLEYTVKTLTEILNNPNFKECSFYYRASW